MYAARFWGDCVMSMVSIFVPDFWSAVSRRWQWMQVSLTNKVLDVAIEEVVNK